MIWHRPAARQRRLRLRISELAAPFCLTSAIPVVLLNADALMSLWPQQCLFLSVFHARQQLEAQLAAAAGCFALSCKSLWRLSQSPGIADAHEVACKEREPAMASCRRSEER